MPNKSLPMNKLRTIIRLYTERVGLRAIAELSRTSRNTVKKYVNKWNALSMTYEAFLAKSDAELYSLFCIDKVPESPNPRLEALEALLPSAMGTLSCPPSRRLQPDTVPCCPSPLRASEQPFYAYGA